MQNAMLCVCITLVINYAHVRRICSYSYYSYNCNFKVTADSNREVRHCLSIAIVATSQRLEVI